MKKIFLLSGIAVFSSASAQQKDLFDIQTHLQKIFKEKKQSPPSLINPSGKNGIRRPSGILPNGDKVYLLEDNMPCVVPDMSHFNMPNISNPNEYFKSPPFNNNTPGTIPNAVKPYRLIVSK